MGDNGQPPAAGPEPRRVSVITFTYDHATHQVTIGGEAMPISLAQMIVGEGARLLDEQRRLAMAQALKQQIDENLRVQALVDSVRTGR